MSGSSNPSHHGAGEELIRAHALVFADQGSKVAVGAGDCLSLPEVSVPERFYPEIEEFASAASDVLGVDASLLRCLDDGNVEEGRPRLYSLVASGSDDQLGDGFRWMDSAEADSVAGLSDTQIASIRLERDRVSGRIPDSPNVPWEWPGSWEGEANEWISGCLGPEIARNGATVTPIRSWSISKVARIERRTGTGTARLYFKASPRFFSNEVSVTAEVADRFPELSPRLAAVDRGHGWMLMEDLGDLTLGAADSIELWCEAMRGLARVQTGFAHYPGTLGRLALERRNTSSIGVMLRQWIQSPVELELRYVEERTRSALKRLEPLVGIVEDLCAQIESIGLPQTLDHGDLDGGNVFVRDSAPVIMDWSDASISCPLFTPALIPQVSRNPQLAGAFLEEWTAFATMDGLETAFEAAKPIAALERAFHYHRNIVAYLTYPSVDLRILEAYIPELLNQAASGLERYQ